MTPGGVKSPVLLSDPALAERENIEKLVNECIKGSDIFLVDIKITRDNKITVLADSANGITLEQCAEISRFIESRLDREKEDYELQVSSPGIGHPFVVKEQYDKSIGRSIMVETRAGQKFEGILKNITGKGFEIAFSVKQKGKSRSSDAEVKNISFTFDEVKSVKEIIKF